MQRLLQILASGKPQTISSLAERLNVSEGVIHLMTAQLVQLGYLQDADSCSVQPGQAGAGCQSCAGCLLAAPQHTWALTEKGLKAARLA